MNTGATNYQDLIARLRAMGTYEFKTGYSTPAELYGEAADAIERALPAITSWNNPDALRTRIHTLTQPLLSVTDSIDSPQEELR